jgi:photosystem II stability/assembly factor-like uncharacterized protein
MRHRSLIALLWIALGSISASASSAVPESAYSGLRWRFLGPFRGGWALNGVGVPENPAAFYFGSAGGGVWKTTDAGVTWTPIFNEQGSASVGALALAPSDSRVLWVGTGQIQQRWDIAAGDGVYRSTDGGATWQHVGLEATRHIGSIWVDPRDPQVALVAALGHVFGPNEERGVFRTEDGGRSWTKVLYRDADTGAADLAGDPAVPDVVFASLWQVRRYPWLDYFQPPMGPGTGVYKSTDGGRTFAAAGKGLPTGNVGRISLAVSPGTSARRVWASVHGAAGAGGLYRSEDGGATWTHVNKDGGLANAYMNQVAPDPRDPETVWLAGRSLKKSTDGGKTFTIAKGSPGGDDYHFLWIDPRNAQRMLVAADQGAVVTLNGGETWSSWYNQATGQLYRLAADDRFPYWVYSGQQDSGTVALATRSDYGQLTFRDWHPVGGDERDGDVPDPRDPQIVYGAGLGGRISRWDERTGQVQNVAPWPVSSYGQRPTTARYRYDWITPLAISPRPPHAIYTAAQMLFRSLDNGQTWQEAGGDLTGTVAGTKGCDGDVPVERATACGFGAIFAVSPSPAADGLVWVGTNNGRVMLTRDDGASWTNVTPPGLEDWSKVNLIDASVVDAGTAYVAVDLHRRDRFEPQAFRTHDYGATWTEIGHGLPQGEWLAVVRQDPRNPRLLYAGTNRGVRVSFDDGEIWQPLQADLPTTGVNDLLVKGDDLIAATQGRGLWSLDAVTPLRGLAEVVAAGQAALLPLSPALRLRGNQNKDTPLPPEEPRAENPPTGAIFDYWLPAESQSPVTLEIADAAGKIVRRFSSADTFTRPHADVYFAERWLGWPASLTKKAGHNRFVWNLRGSQPRAIDYEYSIAAVPGGELSALPLGAFVLPGKYEARLTVGGQTLRQALEVRMDPRVKTTEEDLRALRDLQTEVEAELAKSAELAEEVEEKTKRAENVAAGQSRDAQAAKNAIAAFAGAPRGETAAEVNADLASLATDLENADAAPTAPQRKLLEECRTRFASAKARWEGAALRRLRVGKVGETPRL